MSAYMNISEEFDEIEIIVKDLTTGLPESASENRIGFLVCDSHLECKELLNHLRKKITFPIIGGTTFTYPLQGKNDEVSASLTVLDIEKMNYSIAVSQPLSEADSDRQMKELYDQCTGGLDVSPKMLMMFQPMIPGLNADRFITGLISLSGEIPLFGGMTMNDLDSTAAGVFADGNVYGDRIVLVALGGDIRPVFSVGSQMTAMSEYAPVVTASDGNIVRCVDEMTFCDYMRSIGISPEQRRNGVDALVQYGPLPCRLRNKLQDDDGIPELRCISYTNVEEGSVAFSSSLPVGTRVNIGVIQKNDVVESSRGCLNHLTAQMKTEEESGYRYSAIFSVPCVARYFAMLGGENLESKLLTDEIPRHLAVSAYYGFCEIGPTQGQNGEHHNRSHNASIVMCAL